VPILLIFRATELISSQDTGRRDSCTSTGIEPVSWVLSSSRVTLPLTPRPGSC